jgi:hypothetical protein
LNCATGCQREMLEQNQPHEVLHDLLLESTLLLMRDLKNNLIKSNTFIKMRQQ